MNAVKATERTAVISSSTVAVYTRFTCEQVATDCQYDRRQLGRHDTITLSDLSRSSVVLTKRLPCLNQRGFQRTLTFLYASVHLQSSVLQCLRDHNAPSRRSGSHHLVVASASVTVDECVDLFVASHSPRSGPIATTTFYELRRRMTASPRACASVDHQDTANRYASAAKPPLPSRLCGQQAYFFKCLLMHVSNCSRRVDFNYVVDTH